MKWLYLVVAIGSFVQAAMYLYRPPAASRWRDVFNLTLIGVLWIWIYRLS